MKLISKIALYTIAFFITSAHCSEIIIRPATFADLEALYQLSHCNYQNEFKPLWTQHYSSLTPKHQTIDQFVNEKEMNNNSAIADFIQRQTNNEDYGLLIALTKTPNTIEPLVGYCRFKKENATTMYMNNILVDTSLRKQGIAKQLAFAAMHKWDTVTHCNFRALIHYDFINELYNKHNCIKTGTVALDPNTGKISTDVDAIITHNDYSFVIQK